MSTVSRIKAGRGPSLQLYTRVQQVAEILIESYGLDVGELREKFSGLLKTNNEQWWTDPLRPRNLQRAWSLLAEVTGDSRIGFLLAQKLPSDSLGIIEYLLKSSATLRDAIAVRERFSPLLSEYAKFELEERKQEALLRLVVPFGLELDPVWVDYRLVNILEVAKEILNETSLNVNEVHFCYPNPGPLKIYKRIFGPHVRFRFEMPNAALVFPTHWLDKPLPKSDVTLNEILHDHAESLLGDLPRLGTVAELVQREIVTSLHEGRPTIDEIAKRLHMSQRTLRRQLADEKTGYRELLDRVRASLAGLYLRDKKLTVGQIAYRLGFQSDSAFRRAYRRWTNRVLSAADL